MNNISNDIELFLERFGITRKAFFESILEFLPLQADASLRRYYRISKNEFNKEELPNYNNDNRKIIDFNHSNSFLLMHCPVTYQSIEPFICVAEYLLKNSIRAPRIYSYDKDSGLMVLEDFGDVTLNNYISQNKNDSFFIYKKITDLLIKIQKLESASFLSDYSDEILLNELNVFCKYYYLYAKKSEMEESRKNDFISSFSEVLIENNRVAKNLGLKKTVVLRDFHVDNLMYIKDYKELSDDSIGVLDFQDALLGSPIYDIVSLLDDARIWVADELSDKIKNYYIQKTAIEADYFFETYNILSLQRNLRILGVFARKFILENNDSYLNMIPIMLKYIKRNLKNSTEKIKKIHDLVML